MIRVFDAPGDDENAKKVKNHIVASVIKDVLSSNENPTTQNSKILMTLSKFHTDEIKLDTIIPGNKDADINNDRGVNTTPDTLPISKAISLSFAKMYAPVSLMQFCDTFILPNVNDLFSSKDTIPYSLQRFTEAVEFAVLYEGSIATVYKGNIIKNLIMDCQSYTKYRPNETTGGIFVSWRRKEELPTGA